MPKRLNLGAKAGTFRVMQVTSSSRLRSNLAATLDSVVNDHKPILITRGRGKPAAVLMSLEDYASCDETHYLLSSRCNAERLLRSIVNLDADYSTGCMDLRELPPHHPLKRRRQNGRGVNRPCP